MQYFFSFITIYIHYFFESLPLKKCHTNTSKFFKEKKIIKIIRIIMFDYSWKILDIAATKYRNCTTA